jgi:hypothetical protein
MGQEELTTELKNLILSNGAVMAGVADLAGIPEEESQGYDKGISIAVGIPRDVSGFHYSDVWCRGAAYD